MLITGDIALELLAPELSIRGGPRCVDVTCVPEAAIDVHRDLFFGEHQIGTGSDGAQSQLSIEAKSEATAMKLST